MTISLLLALALAAEDGGGPAPRTNLLKAPQQQLSVGCPKAELLTDGIASTDGDVWDNPRAAILAAGGMVTWDLGALATIDFIRVQADNNDRYILTASADGATWRPVWVAQPVELPGVQTRTSPLLHVQETRFLRLTAEGGDSMYSLTEVEAFESQAALDGAQLQRIAPPPPPPPAPAPPFDTGWLVVLGVAGLGVAYVQWARARSRRLAAPPPEPPRP